MKCEQIIDRRPCGGEMKYGKAMIPVWGTLDGRPIIRGTTLNQIGSKLGTALKCEKCGHSIIPKEK